MIRITKCTKHHNFGKIRLAIKHFIISYCTLNIIFKQKLHVWIVFKKFVFFPGDAFILVRPVVKYYPRNRLSGWVSGKQSSWWQGDDIGTPDAATTLRRALWRWGWGGLWPLALRSWIDRRPVIASSLCACHVERRSRRRPHPNVWRWRRRRQIQSSAPDGHRISGSRRGYRFFIFGAVIHALNFLTFKGLTTVFVSDA